MPEQKSKQRKVGSKTHPFERPTEGMLDSETYREREKRRVVQPNGRVIRKRIT